MKRYLLFMHPRNQPSGGWRDFAGDFDSVIEAIEQRQTGRWYREGEFDLIGHVVDSDTGDIVDE